MYLYLYSIVFAKVHQTYRYRILHAREHGAVTSFDLAWTFGMQMQQALKVQSEPHHDLMLA